MCNFNDNKNDDKNEEEILCSFFIGAVILIAALVGLFVVVT